MKTGILTFHEADSYGAVLQAYALQQSVLKLGRDCEFVTIQAGQHSCKPPVASGPAAVYARHLQAAGEKRKALFADFRQQYLRISRPYAMDENIDADYACFLAGSDQIWNFRIPGADARYFLPFAKPEKRYSYAASFGSDDLPEQAKAWVGQQLSQFRELSLREESGCAIVKELTGREARVCLDPTLLLSREDWDSLTAEETTEEPYALLFLLKYDEELVRAARETAHREGIALRVITAGFMPQLGIAAWNETGVCQWLSAIRHARYVFTHSFHGIVFSLIFGRPFQAALHKGELSTRNGRVEELLSQLQLTAALTEPVQPEYETLWACLGPKREASLAYLRSVIGCD